MLWSKGVGVFVEAARRLRSQGLQARFVMVGRVDKDNPDAVSTEQLAAWQDERVVEWRGEVENMPNVIAGCHIACLPTYYGEGLPKFLLEAASCRRPLVTTNIRGCHDICRHNVNGFCVSAKDVDALTAALARLLNDADLRAAMGTAGREIVLREFTAQRIARQTVDVYASFLGIDLHQTQRFERAA